MAEQLTYQSADNGSIPLSSLHSMPELYFEMVSTSDPRWKAFRYEHYIKSFDPELGKALSFKQREALAVDGRIEYVDRETGETKTKKIKMGERGQQIHFLIWYKGEQVGIISGGSAVYETAARDVFFRMAKSRDEKILVLNSVVNNTVYHLASREKNLFSRVLALWEKVIPYTWFELYEVPVCGFETFIETEETTNEGKGSGYQATGWTRLGLTKGNAKTHASKHGMAKYYGKSTRTFGKTTKKVVFCKWRPGYSALIPVQYKATWQAGAKDKDGLLTREGAEQKALAKVRTARRKEYMGKCFSASTKTVYVYDQAGAQPKEILMELYELIRRLQLALSPDLLKPEWRQRAENEHPTFGHCYTVTEALYHLYGKSRGYKPHVVQVPAMDTTHWWLQNAKGDILDGTREQFTFKNITIPYAEGRGSGFLTREPSKRCRILMDRIGMGAKFSASSGDES